MKVLIFSHKSDIDGMGGVILAKLAFKKVDYFLCETFNLPEKIIELYQSEKIYNYDFIFITDMWLEEPILSKINNDKRLKNKVFVFDHHESAINSYDNKYSFINLKISNELGLCSGTSLFYEFLINNKYLPHNLAIKEFVELTREYDTWEWKTIYNNDKAHKLSLLFDSFGTKGYIDSITKKLKGNSKHFSFTSSEEKVINNKITQINEKIKNYSEKIYYQEIENLKAGIIFINYEYRNDLAEYLRQNNFDLDFVMLVCLDYGTISYRSINNNVNVRTIAEHFGGKGHNKAASSPINKDTLEKIINLLTHN